ncbi:MAG: M23 family metallopeptidase [Salibacteraceae bacterium]
MPLAINPVLSGNYGEPRPNHFHAGIDLKTGGREGLEVRAVETGYVSRIKVSAFGYGKAVYIDHPNGMTSVYAHLSEFSDDIHVFVRKQQYAMESFEVDIYPAKDQLKIDAGQLVGFSGNTGGSGGPHLHFEWRHTASEIPLNPLRMGFDVGDNRPPVLEGLAVVTKSNPSVLKKYGIYAPNKIYDIETEGPAALLIMGFDQQNGANNQNGIYKITCEVEGKRLYRFVADSIPFHESRYVNAFIHYPTYVQYKQRWIRLHRLPGSGLRTVKTAHDGWLAPRHEPYRVRITAADAAGNETSVSLNLRVKAAPAGKANIENGYAITYNQPFNFSSEHIEVEIPAGTLYENAVFRHTVHHKSGLAQSPIYGILDEETPAHSEFSLRIRCEGPCAKGVLVSQTTRDGKVLKALKSICDEEACSAHSKSFGYFTIVSDTVPPVIQPLQTGAIHHAGNKPTRIKISDNLSGIASFRCEVDGQWILAEYDYKTDMLEIHPAEIPRCDEPKEMRITVTDGADNTNEHIFRYLHP